MFLLKKSALVALLTFMFIVIVAPFICLAAGPTSAEYGVVLNLSGKQRMLSQKMSKEMLLIALKVNSEVNLKNLSTTSSLFDKTLKGLRDGNKELRLPPTSSKRIIKQLDKIDKKYWQAFYKIVKKVLAAKNVTKKQVAKIAETSLPLLSQMNKCVNLYEKDARKAGLKSDPSLAVAINLSGKQRMLSQKMSKEFLLIAYGHQVEDNKLNLLETLTLFDRTLQGLMDGDEVLDLPGTKNKAIRKQLSIVMDLWGKFKVVVAIASNPKTTSISSGQVMTVAKDNLPLLKEMNKAVGMYEREAAK